MVKIQRFLFFCCLILSQKTPFINSKKKKKITMSSKLLGSLLGGISEVFDKDGTAVGVDVGSNSIKVVSLKREGEKIVLDNYAVVRSEDKLLNLANPGVINDLAGVITKETLETADIKEKKVNVATPSFTSLVVTIEVPKMPEEQFEKAIRKEVSKYIPVSIEDVVYDWQVINEDVLQANEKAITPEERRKLQDQSNSVKILVIAIIKEISARYNRVFKDNGLELTLLEIDSISLARALAGAEGEISLILDIGHETCNVIISSREGLLLNRTIDVGGDTITKKIAEALGIDFAEAERLKIEKGLHLVDPKSEKSVFLEPVGKIVDELKRTLKIFKKDFQGLKVKEVYLTGGSAAMIGLKDFLEKELGLPVLVANPLRGIAFAPEVKESLLKHAPLLTIAIGLALANFEK